MRPLEGLGACFPLSSLLQTSRHNSPRPCCLPRLGSLVLHSQSWKQRKRENKKPNKTPPVCDSAAVIWTNNSVPQRGPPNTELDEGLAHSKFTQPVSYTALVGRKRWGRSVVCSGIWFVFAAVVLRTIFKYAYWIEIEHFARV